MEALEEDVEAGIEDGQLINPHAMDPQTVLRFVKTLGAWPGKVVVIACEPADVEDMGLGLTEQVEQAVDGAVALVVETIEELRTDAIHGWLGDARAVALQRDLGHRRQARGRATR